MKLLTAALAALFLSSVASGATIAGSDIAGPVVAPLLTPTGLTTDFKGTFDALRDLRSGKAAVALLFVKDGEKIPEVVAGTWRAAPVAYQPIYVAVHRANNATEIDIPTLAGLYGKTNDTKYDTWRCLPASGLSQGPFALAPHPGKGLTVSHFRSEVLGGGDFKPSVRFATSDDDAESRVVSTVNGIVLLSRPPTTGNLKVLAVADGRPGKPTQAYAPTASNLHSGDYPLRVTLFVVYPKSGASVAAPAVRAVLSEDAANLLTAKGLLPAPENIRKKFTQSLDS